MVNTRNNQRMDASTVLQIVKLATGNRLYVPLAIKTILSKIKNAQLVHQNTRDVSNAHQSVVRNAIQLLIS